MKRKILSLVLCLAMCVGMAATFSGCGSSSDAFVVMVDQLDGLFNPFFSTSASDGTIVAMTQIGMLSSKYEDGEVQVAYGDNEAVVTKDYDITENDDDTITLLQAGLRFEDRTVGSTRFFAAKDYQRSADRIPQQTNQHIP